MAAPAIPDRLRARIEREGPLPWPTWMEAALYDPDGGYYTRPGRKTGPGDDADFATSPTLHPFLAHCVAEEAAACWERLGRPAPFPVYEFGGGEGDLARDALAHLDEDHPELAAAVRWLHVEASPTHRDAQRAGADERVAWTDGLPTAGTSGFVVAHEFLDALPFWWLERHDDGWRGLHVGLEDGGFALLRGPAPDEAALAPDGVPTGRRVAVMHAAKAWLETVAARLRAGGVLVVDYGGDHVWRRDRDGTVRTFRSHRHGLDPWLEPGEQDITASVDFAQARAWAEAAGLRLAFEESQEAFLMRHGALEALNRIDRSTVEGASAYLRLRQLLLPTAMGEAFRVARWEV